MTELSLTLELSATRSVQSSRKSERCGFSCLEGPVEQELRRERAAVPGDAHVQHLGLDPAVPRRRDARDRVAGLVHLAPSPVS